MAIIFKASGFTSIVFNQFLYIYLSSRETLIFRGLIPSTEFKLISCNERTGNVCQDAQSEETQIPNCTAANSDAVLLLLVLEQTITNTIPLGICHCQLQHWL